MKERVQNKKGITLIELIIAVAIFAVIAAGVTAVLTTGLKTYNLDYNSTVGQQNLRVAMIKISKDLRSPTNKVTVSSKVLSLNGKSFSVSSGKLTCNSVVYATGIGSIAADYTDSTKQVVQVDLTSTDGGKLSTKVSLK